MNLVVFNKRQVATVATLLLTAFCAGCGKLAARELSGVESPAPGDFGFVGVMSPCYLELQPGMEALRVNCFHRDGVLHIHSSRFAKLPRFSGENWTNTVRRAPDVRIQIEDRIYALRASPIDDDVLRTRILHERGYPYAWDGITIVRFTPRTSSTESIQVSQPLQGTSIRE